MTHANQFKQKKMQSLAGKTTPNLRFRCMGFLLLFPLLASCEIGFLGPGSEPPKPEYPQFSGQPERSGGEQGGPAQSPASPGPWNQPVPPAIFPGGGTTPGPSGPPPPKPICTFTVNCPTNRLDINYQCVSDTPRRINGPLITASCEKIKAALSGKGLPTGKTSETLLGGPNCEVVCQGGNNGELRTQIVTGDAAAGNGSSSTVQLGFTMPDVVCIDMRNIINSLKLE